MPLPSAEINKEAAKYIRHSNRTATNNPGQELSTKDLAIPQTIKGHYAEIDKLSNEKIQLAERIEQLVNRARARLDHDLNKVLLLQGEIEAPIQGGTYFSSSSSRNPVAQTTEALRTAIAIPEPVTLTPVGSAPPPTKSA
ncbi:hypothetical protein NLI96_g3348 [Meripilus lineatus]|uniref:Inhibitor of growth protein N-terminal histone-binding domain-containing protein n=1 Tax=Meripilus lineatus TaxID=2056292 RepID=A0AAD5VCE3_9APHY|nr:hypothetical protein NLI96_g3348 [Physisporinus lineatus]